MKKQAKVVPIEFKGDLIMLIETHSKFCPDGEVIKDFVEAHWQSALLEKFASDLSDILNLIMQEIRKLRNQGAGLEIWQHVFPYKESKVIFASSWDKEREIIIIHADLVSYHDVLAEFGVESGEEEAVFFHPVPASKADPVH